MRLLICFSIFSFCSLYYHINHHFFSDSSLINQFYVFNVDFKIKDINTNDNSNIFISQIIQHIFLLFVIHAASISHYNHIKENFKEIKIIEFIIENELVTKNHPLSCYTSRKIDYSAKLNEILNQELSSKIVINEENYYDDNKTWLTEDLGKFSYYFYFK